MTAPEPEIEATPSAVGFEVITRAGRASVRTEIGRLMYELEGPVILGDPISTVIAHWLAAQAETLPQLLGAHQAHARRMLAFRLGGLPTHEQQTEVGQIVGDDELEQILAVMATFPEDHIDPESPTDPLTDWYPAIEDVHFLIDCVINPGLLKPPRNASFRY